ncbi:MAG: PAS domain-containing protein, partial [Myxococcota bacterium]
MTYHPIADSLADGVVVVAADDAVVYANPAARALLGRTLVGRRFDYPLHDVEIPVVQASELRFVALRVSAGQWDDRPARIILVRDITEERQRDQQLARLRACRQRAALNVLASGVAHEINNPAAFMMANSAVMRDIADEFEALLGEAQLSRDLLEKYQVAQSLSDLREMIDDNEQGLSRIRTFVRELRAMTSDDGYILEQIDINEAVALACDICARTLPRGVALVRNFEAVAPIAGDLLRLTMAIAELIDNAARSAAAARAA